MTLTPAEIEQFVTDGFVRIDDAFTKEIAASWREKLWAEAKLSPDDPGKWPPVVRLPGYPEPPGLLAFNPRYVVPDEVPVQQRATVRPQAAPDGPPLSYAARATQTLCSRRPSYDGTARSFETPAQRRGGAQIRG